MPFIFEGFGQATLVFTIPGPGGPANVVFGFNDNELETPDDLALVIGAAWGDAGSMNDWVDSGASLVECRVLIRRGGNLVAGVAPLAYPGGQAAQGSPPQVAALFQKLTGFAGRNRRGRLYLPASPLPPDTGIYNPATVTAFEGVADEFMDRLLTGIVPMALLHVNPADPPTLVTDLVPVALVATQRRRVR